MKGNSKEETIKILHSELNVVQKAEEDYFASDKSMCSVKDVYKQVLWKARSLWMLDEIIDKYKLDFTGNVLELGGGYGVQAAYLKAKYGDSLILHYSDVSLTAVKTSARFEDLFKVKIDYKYVMEAEHIPLADEMFDCIFFFAAFHHIQNHEQSIAACYRALKKGGRLYLILEPSCPKYMQKLYARHTKRDSINEKSFSRGEYNVLLKSLFPKVTQHDFTGYYNRESRRALIYYFFISLIPKWLVRLLPCSQVVVAIK